MLRMLKQPGCHSRINIRSRTGHFGAVVPEPVWPALLAGAFSPVDFTLVSVVVVVEPPGVDTVSDSFTLVSSLHPLRVRQAARPATANGARKRFIGWSFVGMCRKARRG